MEYPTIETFEYSENLQVYCDQEVPFLTYKQQTELVDSEGRLIRKSHWETGILRPLKDGSVELACVQGGGRVEVLRGEIQSQGSKPGAFSLSFHSKLVGNDGRVRGSTRDWTVNGNHFEYVMVMATTRVEAPTIHLKARLTKK